MPVETMTSDAAWPSLSEGHGTIILEANSTSNNEWEMIAENEQDINGNNNNNRHVVILPTDGNISKSNDNNMGRPRSATVGGEGAANAAGSNRVLKEYSSFGDSTKGSDFLKAGRRSLRRCASTPDLLVSDNDHEVIVEDETDDDEQSDEGEIIEECDSNEVSENSFEVLSEKNDDDQGSAPIIIDEDTSMGTSSWTLPSAATAPNPPSSNTTASVWGTKSAPSFRDILAKNADKPMCWGSDKEKTEAMLRDSHRKHHLRVRTKPKFVVADDVNGSGMLKHAHSTGDLTKLQEMAEQERHRAGRGKLKKQFSALMEDDEEGDLIIGRGDGTHGTISGGGVDVSAEILGDTDAMDFYHRKDKGSQATSNKKKERPDEAKRKEISMYKKELQREKQLLKSKGGDSKNTEGGGDKKKKKNEKGFGGKKERRRL